MGNERNGRELVKEVKIYFYSKVNFSALGGRKIFWGFTF
jgi:hypothetical protein